MAFPGDSEDSEQRKQIAEESQTQRVLIRDRYKRAMERRLFSQTEDASAITQANEAVQTTIVADESCIIQIESTEDARSGELERYVGRVVQYAIYCIAGNQASNMLQMARNQEGQSRTVVPGAHGHVGLGYD